MPENISLSNLGSAGFAFSGAGFSVSNAGDVNGDGFDDFIVGTPGVDGGGSGAGKAYVIFGRSSGFSAINLADLGTGGFAIEGGAAGDGTGWSVSSAGDVNGDGFDDVIIGAPFGDDGGNNEGGAYLIFGKANGFEPTDLSSLDPLDGIKIIGAPVNPSENLFIVSTRTGWSTSSALPLAV